MDIETFLSCYLSVDRAGCSQLPNPRLIVAVGSERIASLVQVNRLEDSTQPMTEMANKGCVRLSTSTGRS